MKNSVYVLISRENVLNDLSDVNGCEHGHISDTGQGLKHFTACCLLYVSYTVPNNKEIMNKIFIKL